MAQTQKVRGTATTIRRTPDGKMHITYHATDVVVFDAWEIVLDSNGWRTATTKLRMNQAANEFGLDFQVYQKAGVWFVSFAGINYPFRDGMRLARNTGTVVYY